MSLEDIREFIASYPIIFIPVTLIAAYLLFRLTRFVLFHLQLLHGLLLRLESLV